MTFLICFTALQFVALVLLFWRQIYFERRVRAYAVKLNALSLPAKLAFLVTCFLAWNQWKNRKQN